MKTPFGETQGETLKMPGAEGRPGEVTPLLGLGAAIASKIRYAPLPRARTRLATGMKIPSLSLASPEGAQGGEFSRLKSLQLSLFFPRATLRISLPTLITSLPISGQIISSRCLLLELTNALPLRNTMIFSRH